MNYVTFAYLYKITGLVPKGAAEKGGVVRRGDLFSAIDGKDVTGLSDSAVAELFRGSPCTPFTLDLCGNAQDENVMREKLLEAARNCNDEDVQSLLNSGAKPDALFRGIVISRRKI